MGTTPDVRGKEEGSMATGIGGYSCEVGQDMDDEGWHGEHDSTELTRSFAVKDLPTVSGFITAGIGFGSLDDSKNFP